MPMKTAVLILGLLVCLGQNVGADAVLKEILGNQTTLSPNKEFLATATGLITIQDLKSGRKFDLVEVLDPLYCLAWAGDSKSLFIVEHIAGGTCLSVVQFLNGKWIKSSIDPPPDGDYDSYKVVQVKPRFDSARIVYITANRGDNGGPSLTQFVTFDLSLKNLSTSHIRYKTITGDQYGELNDRY
jgi:hypothetical protein